MVEAQPLSIRGYTYQHLSRPPIGFHGFWGHAALASRKTVRDRFHMSQVVYEQARGDIGRKLTPTQYTLLDALLTCYGAYTVVLTMDEELLRDRWQASDRAEMYDLSMALTVNCIYADIAKSAHEYSCAVNGTVHLTREHPFVDDVQAQRIIRAYIDWQDTIDRLLIDQSKCAHGRLL